MDSKKTELQYVGKNPPVDNAATKQVVTSQNDTGKTANIAEQETLLNTNPNSYSGNVSSPKDTGKTANIAEQETLLNTNPNSYPSIPRIASLPSEQTTILPSAELKENGEINWIHTSKSRLEIVSSIGKGGAGEVVKAIDHDIGRVVAIKKIRSEIVSPQMIIRFVNEIKTVGKLEHPNIIPIHDVGVDNSGNYFFIMKYVEGETLTNIINKLKSGDPETVKKYTFERRMEIFRDLLEAMAYSHNRGIIHRDIKPENIMVGPFGEVLLMDWGIAKKLNDDKNDTIIESTKEEKENDNSQDRFWKTVDGMLIGTPAYMSPEQARGEKLDERSDVYSLSVLLHELLTLNHYLDGIDNFHDVLEGVSNKDPGILSYKMGGKLIPADLIWFVHKGMNKNKEERYQSVNEMIKRLDDRANGIIPVQCPITFTKRVNGTMMSFLDSHPVFGFVGFLTLNALGIFGIVEFIKLIV